MSTAISPPPPPPPPTAATVAATLDRLRCWTHPVREAAARCPSCARFFCRECVTEHAGRFLCVSCLRALLAAGAEAPAGRWQRVGPGLGRAAALGLSVLALWGFFALLGRVLARLPATFHEGTLWQ